VSVSDLSVSFITSGAGNSTAPSITIALLSLVGGPGMVSILADFCSVSSDEEYRSVGSDSASLPELSMMMSLTTSETSSWLL
jgi:hypothetical protein